MHYMNVKIPFSKTYIRSIATTAENIINSPFFEMNDRTLPRRILFTGLKIIYNLKKFDTFENFKRKNKQKGKLWMFLCYLFVCFFSSSSYSNCFFCFYLHNFLIFIFFILFIAFPFVVFQHFFPVFIIFLKPCFCPHSGSICEIFIYIIKHRHFFLSVSALKFGYYYLLFSVNYF